MREAAGHPELGTPEPASAPGGAAEHDGSCSVLEPADALEAVEHRWEVCPQGLPCGSKCPEAPQPPKPTPQR